MKEIYQFVDAKTEYTKQLITILSPDIYFGIKKIYNESKNRAIDNELPSSALFFISRFIK